MNATMSPPGGVADAPITLQQFTRESVVRWSRLCQDFFDLERKQMLEKSPSASDLAEHRTTIKWLIRTTRAMLLVAGDPDYPEHTTVRELDGRLTQLQHSWRQFHEPLPEAEGDQLLKSVFPG